VRIRRRHCCYYQEEVEVEATVMEVVSNNTMLLALAVAKTNPSSWDSLCFCACCLMPSSRYLYIITSLLLHCCASSVAATLSGRCSAVST
jgi:hypothetical protein